MRWDTCTKYEGVGDHVSPSKYMNDFSRLEMQNKFMLKNKSKCSSPNDDSLGCLNKQFFFICFYKMEGYLYKIFALGYENILF